MESSIEIRPGRFININYLPHAHSDSTVFLIHGMGGRGEQWREQLPLLQRTYNIVIPDLLGNGKSHPIRSSNGTNPYSFTEYDEDIHAVFNRYASSHNIIVGHSYGGALAVSLAIDHQDMIDKLLLICPLPCSSQIKIPNVYYLPSFILELLRPWLEKEFLRLAFDVSAKPTLINEEKRATRQNTLTVIKSILHGMRYIPHLDMTMLTIPTCIVLGEHDGIIPPQASRQFYEALPHHQFITFQHAAHMDMLEKPEEFNRVMLDFLSQSIQ